MWIGLGLLGRGIWSFLARSWLGLGCGPAGSDFRPDQHQELFVWTIWWDSWMKTFARFCSFCCLADISVFFHLSA